MNDSGDGRGTPAADATAAADRRNPDTEPPAEPAAADRRNLDSEPPAEPAAAGRRNSGTEPVAGPAGADAAGRAVPQSRRVAPSRGSQLDQLMPVVLFLVFYNLDAVQVAGLNNIEVAVIAATAWSIKAAYSRVRRGLPIGKWLPIITAYLVARAAVAIAVERELVDFGVSSEAVYFGIGIGTKILVGLVAVATIVAGRPLALWAVRFVPDLPEALRLDRRFVATLRDVTWVVALYELGSSVWDIWLYNNSGVSWFVTIRFVANYVVSFVLIFATLVYVERRFSKIEGCPSLVDLVSRATRRAPAARP